MPKETWQNLLDQVLKARAKTDVFAFGEYVFGFRPAAHHRELVEFIHAALDAGENCVALEPRGHAKTTWANTIFLSWYIATHKDIRVGLLSNTAKQSNDFSRAIRWTFEANERFKEIFGDLVGRGKWTDVEWLRKDSIQQGTKDVTLYSNGAGGAIISKRFDLIVCDDILDEENTANPEQRQKVEDWFWKTLKPCLAPGGSIVVIGTRWAEEDLYEKLITPPPDGRGWRSIVRSALTVTELPEGDVLTALWPEVWPVEALLRERTDMGSAMFSCAYQNDISGLMSGNVFRGKDFQYFNALDPEKNYVFTMGVDLASSEKETADYTARVVVAEDDEHNHYVLNYYRDRRESGHREFVLDGYDAYPRISKIVIETNQFQSTLVQNILDTTRLPVVGRKADVDKVTRARSVAARYEAHKVYHHVALKDSVFERELLSFPKGHDDLIDALGYALDLSGGGLSFTFARRRR